MKDLTNLELQQIITYYKNKASDLELEVVKKQLSMNKLEEKIIELNSLVGTLQDQAIKAQEEVTKMTLLDSKKTKAKAKA